MSTTTPDLMDRWARTMDQASQLAWDWWDQSQAMMEPWRDVVTGMATSPEPDDHDHDHGRHHDHDHRGGRDGCGCHDCDRHPGRQRGRGGQQPCGCEKRDARAGSAQHHGSSCRRAD
ncbi:MAG TPA: hypothetical protein VHM65_03970, partial [Candidatus Lustribacter sp.]|nr:hypothetical protein [Candidatus Lustribacter sp.]